MGTLQLQKTRSRASAIKNAQKISKQILKTDQSTAVYGHRETFAHLNYVHVLPVTDKIKAGYYSEVPWLEMWRRKNEGGEYAASYIELQMTISS